MTTATRNEQGQFVADEKPVIVVTQESEHHYATVLDGKTLGADSLDRLTRYLRELGYRVQVNRLPKTRYWMAHGL